MMNLPKINSRPRFEGPATVGDVFEVLAAVLLVVAAALFAGAALALFTSAVALVYFAHCYDDVEVR